MSSSKVKSHSYNKNILTFINNFTRKTYIYLLKEKYEAFCKFKEFKILVEKQYRYDKQWETREINLWTQKGFVCIKTNATCLVHWTWYLSIATYFQKHTFKHTIYIKLYSNGNIIVIFLYVDGLILIVNY